MSKTKSILFELGTEELPAKSLQYLAKNLLENVLKSLDNLDIDHQKHRYFATPRRIGFLIENVATSQPNTIVKKEGPFVDKAFDQQNLPTPAAIGFARACNVNIYDLKTTETAKGERLVYQFTSPGKQTITCLPESIEKALKKLPIAKIMRWGDSDIQFIRPVHWVVLLFDNSIVECEILGCQASNITYGHRFHAPEAIALPCPDNYFDILREKGQVIADFSERKQRLISEANALALKKNANVLFDEKLIEEITAIVEWPKALCCDFDSHFLRIPQEALILAMQNHQKSLPMVDHSGKLINHFITISNIQSKNPDTVISGNNKVMAARLADAAFFYDTDVKTSLKDYLPQLKKITFQQQLGSMFDRANRIAHLGQYIAKAINADTEKSYRAGLMAKTDLTTLMVYEFTELQGIIGKYYAKAHYEDELICQSIEQQYWPKQAGGKLPTHPVGQAVALAEKIDTLVGIFGIGNLPSGDKDPLGLRRAAIGVLRILKEKKCVIALPETIDYASSLYGDKFSHPVKAPLLKFFIDRLRVICQEASVPTNVFEAVLAVDYCNIVDFDNRIQAVLRFLETPGADRLCNNNKRVANLLQKQSSNYFAIDPALFEKPQEKILYKVLLTAEKQSATAIANKDYLDAFNCLMVLDEAISDFFDQVMVMDNNISLQKNRLALLHKLHYLFRQIADITKLS